MPQLGPMWWIFFPMVMTVLVLCFFIMMTELKVFEMVLVLMMNDKKMEKEW